jgi:aldehyde dehydrogenase (NAD+)
MNRGHQFFIDGAWVSPVDGRECPVIDPATGSATASILLGNAEDVDRAVMAARRAFDGFAATSREERLALLNRILEVYTRRSADLADAITREMGAPAKLSLNSQVGSGEAHIRTMIDVLSSYSFEKPVGTTLVIREPIGVVGMITPWNWPLNQITCKVMPAIAAGCTMVLKPSELAPLSAITFAEIMEEAGTPPGVFNLVHGDGPGVGEALARHPEVDMMSITGSNRAGIAVAKAAADTIKRVHQELGGKSANIILDDADFDAAVREGVLDCFGNSGQSCNAPTRMLVPHGRMARAEEVAREAAESLQVGAPGGNGVDLGPVANGAQFARVRALIEAGIAEGAHLVTGGPGLPDGVDRGYFVRPTVFARVKPNMRIAREEIFGPVISIIGYEDEDDAVAIANDSPYGLAAYISSGNLERARKLSRRLRVGNVHINFPPWDTYAPFGGYKQSGNGREYGAFGLDDFLEIKGVVGYGTPQGA